MGQDNNYGELEQKLKLLPEQPGVYLMKNAEGEIRLSGTTGCPDIRVRA